MQSEAYNKPTVYFYLLLLVALACLFDAESRAEVNLSHESFYNKTFQFEDLAESVSTPFEISKKLESLKKTSPSKLFSSRGKIDSFEYYPKSYRTRHSILYYLPEEYDFDRYPSGIPALVFLHGGGASTSTYESAKHVAKYYFEDLLPIIKDLGIIAIFPSSSVGWAHNTRMLLREFNPIIRRELPVDPDRMILSGHSMGAMGITRQAHRLIDQFSSFLPMAAGMQDWARKPRNLITYFDTRFIHINGKHDHFRSFKSRSLKVERKIQRLERDFGLKSGYELYFHNGGHNYRKALVKEQLQRLVNEKRDLYDRKIFPFADHFLDYQYGNQPSYENYMNGSYKWIEISDWHKTTEHSWEGIDFRAKVESNLISIRMDKKAKDTIKELKIYLSDKLINYNEQVFLMLNGRLIYGGYPKRDYELMYKLAQEKQDHRFLFTSVLKFNIKYERAKWTKDTLW